MATHSDDKAVGPRGPIYPTACECPLSLPHGLGFWNSGMGKRWNRLRSALAAAYPGLEFFKAVEPQKRGALHLHIPLWTPHGVDPLHVQALALGAGFGCVMKLHTPTADEQRRTAGYVSKYVTKACDQRDEVPWDVIDSETGEVTEALDAPYRTWSSSRLWGPTLKAIGQAVSGAARRRAEALAAAGEGDQDGASGASSRLVGSPGVTVGAVP
jgi:hypothetical protein